MEAESYVESVANAVGIQESSDSNLTTEATRKIGRLKGVVQQPNGNYGAQIYANHQRIWLGTFKSDADAGRAYNSAAIKLRGTHYSDHNFPLTMSESESEFQMRFTLDEILGFIKDGTYPSKYACFLADQNKYNNDKFGVYKRKVIDKDITFGCRLLFQKALTPSDVGKLNRLVIPKRHAIKFFDGEGEVSFYDKLMKIWKFRYCYWKSSQSYVFTRGWNRFIKDKQLKANDVVAFYAYNQNQFVIDVSYKDPVPEYDDRQKPDKKGFKLFGVQINLAD